MAAPPDVRGRWLLHPGEKSSRLDVRGNDASPSVLSMLSGRWV